jgi:hypothetical protein
MDTNRTLKIVLVVVIVALLLWWLGKRRARVEATYTRGPRVSTYVPFDEMPFDTVPPANATPAPPLVPPTNVAADLLPKPTAPQVQDFGEFAPKALQGQNFLEVSKQIGVDTQGSSLRNANYQLRSDPPNPRFNVGPWSGSTIDPDLMRRPLE